MNPWWAHHEVHSTHGPPPAAFARPAAAHGPYTGRPRVAKRRGPRSRQMTTISGSFLISCARRTIGHVSTRCENNTLTRDGFSRTDPAPARAVRAGPAERGRSLCCTCMMQRAQLLLADSLVDAGHASAAFCSMRARKAFSAVAVPPRWRGGGSAPLMLHMSKPCCAWTYLRYA